MRVVPFILSIDGTGSTIEKIRTLCDWNIIQKNIDTLRHRLSPKFMVNTVLQKDNLDNIPELANWIDSKEISIWHAEILTRPEQFYFKNYASKLQWPESLWENACVQKNMQVYKNLKFIESACYLLLKRFNRFSNTSILTNYLISQFSTRIKSFYWV